MAKQLKVAIIFSGLLRGEYRKLIDIFKNNVHYADFFYVTWDDQEPHDFIDAYFKQPVMKYNPGYDQLKNSIKYLRENKYPYDVKQNTYHNHTQESAVKNLIYRASQKHRTKQILCHGMALDHFSISKNYDVAVRVRYDTIVTQHFFNILMKCIVDCYENSTPITFIPTNDEWGGPNANTDGYILDEEDVLADVLIVHRTDMFSTEYMWKLHNSKMLQGSEGGWDQLISQPYNKNPIVYANYVKLKHLDENGIKSYFNKAKRTIRCVETNQIVTNNKKHKVNSNEGNNMKVAVLYCGTIPDWCNAHDNILRLRKILPKADFFFTSWDNQPLHNFVNRYYHEPTHHYNSAVYMLKNYITAYRKFKESNWNVDSLPYCFHHKSAEFTKKHLEDVISNRKYYRNQNKQHIIYALTYRDFIKKEHDVVIRVRYDSIIQPEFENIVKSVCEQAYYDRRPIGFHHFTNSLEDLLNPVPPHEETELHQNGVFRSLRDFMIIHRRDMFDPEFVLYLWETKALTFAEAAWYQILCEPYHVKQKHYIGYVKLQKQMLMEEHLRQQFAYLDIEKDRKKIIELDKSTGQAIQGIHLDFHEQAGPDYQKHPWQPNCHR